MGNCMSNHYDEDCVSVPDTTPTRDDRPYEERTREERMDSEARQMIACMNRNRWD